ncbi:MAG: hypothetical protein NXI16_01140 [Alphaproteobacteria bacterium]|nr:hypothetical protein [Alphaproteobacteria bacterium]
MDQIDDYSDVRHKAWCIHCTASLETCETNRDHVPSRSLLDKPYPPELPVVEICTSCNTSFSQDEEYFAAFLGAVITGSTDPDVQTIPAAERVLRRNPSLKARIDRSRKDFKTLGGENRTIWEPEMGRVKNALVKNARGHVYFELGQPAMGEPVHFHATPLETFTAEEREAFFSMPMIEVWPEVGSRMMTRVFTGQDMEDGWIVVQDGVYRFAVAEDDGFAVKIVLREYLAAEVIWSY